MATFKYINMPRLVAHYLREFSFKWDEPQTTTLVTDLYKFIWCLCLPFVSKTFNRARQIALAIAECTDSAQQILAVIEAITGANLYKVPMGEELSVPYDGSGDDPQITYDGSGDAPIAVYSLDSNIEVIFVELNGASRSDVEGYLNLLVPFYVSISIIYSDN